MAIRCQRLFWTKYTTKRVYLLWYGWCLTLWSCDEKSWKTTENPILSHSDDSRFAVVWVFISLCQLSTWLLSLSFVAWFKGIWASTATVSSVSIQAKVLDDLFNFPFIPYSCHVTVGTVWSVGTTILANLQDEWKWERHRMDIMYILLGVYQPM